MQYQIRDIAHTFAPEILKLFTKGLILSGQTTYNNPPQHYKEYDEFIRNTGFKTRTCESRN